MSTKITLDVKGMTCDGCEHHVGDALASAGLTDLEVDWHRGLATGVDTGSFDLTKATDALKWTSYEIVSVSTSDEEPTDITTSGDGDYDLLYADFTRDWLIFS